jgi:hypothetical protein
MLKIRLPIIPVAPEGGILAINVAVTGQSILTPR